MVVVNLSIFDLFDLRPCFKIDQEKLRCKYLALQRECHPDQMVNKIETSNHSIKINQAFKILNNERMRAEYLLKLQGLVVNSEYDNVKLSRIELLEILEIREKIDEEISPEKLELLAHKIATAKDNFFENFDYLLENNPDMAAKITIKARYFEKILEEIKARKNAIT